MLQSPAPDALESDLLVVPPEPCCPDGILPLEISCIEALDYHVSDMNHARPLYGAVWAEAVSIELRFGPDLYRILYPALNLSCLIVRPPDVLLLAPSAPPIFQKVCPETRTWALTPEIEPLPNFGKAPLVSIKLSTRDSESTLSRLSAWDVWSRWMFVLRFGEGKVHTCDGANESPWMVGARAFQQKQESVEQVCNGFDITGGLSLSEAHASQSSHDENVYSQQA